MIFLCICERAKCWSHLDVSSLSALLASESIERICSDSLSAAVAFRKHPSCPEGSSLHVQIVLGVLSAWGIGIYTAMKVFGGKKEEPAAAQ